MQLVLIWLILKENSIKHIYKQQDMEKNSYTERDQILHCPNSTSQS
jgi:hypothetical protein